MRREKRCSQCKDSKPNSEFNKNCRTKDGLRCQCKSCQRAYRQSEKGKVVNLKAQKKYLKTLKGKVALEADKKRKKIANRTIKGHLRFVFSRMIGRCYNPKNKDYKYYGGRGIAVRFLSFEYFYDYVVYELKVDPRELTIDRIDNDGDYERGNIRFVTQADNNRNKPKKRRRNNDSKNP